MLYDGNFRIEKDEPELIPLDISIPELILRNEAGALHVFSPYPVVPFLISHLSERQPEHRWKRKPLVALPGSGECFYCITDPESRNPAGGFVYDAGMLYFASHLINLAHDRDAYRQIPDIIHGTYFTDLSFRQVVESFAQEKIPLFRTLDEVVYYDKHRSRWPNATIPNLGAMSYEEAFRLLQI
ncbi:hypothetical protein HZB02_07745 [Candidatus Woesearchaeota archaeon]|nr:hypothetical protein [Candidatus Woesearchaeota archaeon]